MMRLRSIKSIQAKFVLLIASALITMALLIGSVSLLNINDLVKRDSESMINSVCTEQSLRLDYQLKLMEQAVDSIYYFAQGELHSLESLKDLTYRRSYLRQVEALSQDISRNTEGVIAIYFRMNPELSDMKSGFFLVKDMETNEFLENELTDLAIYGEDDMAHVGWYYQPIKAGKPIWMSPYYNENINAEMISYVIPFFHQEKLVGVIGMDIDFKMFVDMAQKAAVYDDGKANLIDVEQKMLFSVDEDSDNGHIQQADISDTLHNILNGSEANEDTLQRYSEDGINYKMAYKTLRNGMKLISYSPVRQINKSRNEMLLLMVFITLGSVVIFVIFTTYMTRQITHPLESLTDAAKKIANGNWDVDIECRTEDEVKTLANSIQFMANKLKDYVAEVNSLAYKDGLTGVKNKAFYLSYTTSLSQEGAGEPYAVVLFDVNNLKKINDNYGHEAGDDLIITSCRYICRNFTHSPVFRIGGDEFVAILRGNDFENRFDLLKSFEENMEGCKIGIAPFSPISVAFGMSEDTSGTGDYEEVFRTADKAMYAKKMQMKGGIKPR